MAVNLWTSERNKILTYLWYLDVEDMAIAEKFTGIPEVECSLKYSAFPTKLPAILKHASHLNAFPQMLLRTSLPENFKILENKICKTGLFTAEKVYGIWLKISNEASQPLESCTRWNKYQEKIIAYLWYAGIKNGPLASKFTGMTMKQCSGKWMQFPGRLPDELAHDYKMNKKDVTTFEELEKHLTEKGLKTADQVYNIWQNTYRNTCKVRWSSSDLTKLCRAVFLSKKSANGGVSWSEITHLFTNKTQQQCEHAYRVHRKKIVVSSGNIDKLKGNSSSRSLCECFLKDEVTTITEDIGSHDLDLISRNIPSPLFEMPTDNEMPEDFDLDIFGAPFNKNDMLDPTYTLLHQSPFSDIPMDLNFPEEACHSPLHSL